MTRTALTIRFLAIDAFGCGGWFAASVWQQQPMVRSAVKLLFRPAADGAGNGPGKNLSFKGISISLNDLKDAASFRALLEKIRDSAPLASPQEAEAFISNLLEQMSALDPSDIRSLAFQVTSNDDLKGLMDQTAKALSLRMLSKDSEQHLFLTLAKIVQRDPDRMLLIAEAMPDSDAKKQFLGHTLAMLSLDRPNEVIAMLNGADPPLKGKEANDAIISALYTLSATSFADAAKAWEGLSTVEMKMQCSQVFSEKINTSTEDVMAWMKTMPENLRAGVSKSILNRATPETAARWMAEMGNVPGTMEAAFSANAILARKNPAAALDWFSSASFEGTDWDAGQFVWSIPTSHLIEALPKMTSERRMEVLKWKFQNSQGSFTDLVAAGTSISGETDQRELGRLWANGNYKKLPQASAELAALPPGPMREGVLAGIGQSWARQDPSAYINWLKSLPASDQTVALSKTDPKLWSKPENAAFLTMRSPAEQLPYLDKVYATNATGAAAVLEKASAQGASPEALDKAAKSLATSWQDRNPATARAFALSLPDQSMADSVLFGLASNSKTPAAREAATAAIQDPILRTKAQRAAAMQALGIR